MFGNDQFTKILLHFDGADGGTVFTDNSVLANIFTASGNAQTATTSFSTPQFGTASGKFDGTTDFISCPDNAALRPGTGDFTVDFWIRYNVGSVNHTVYEKGYVNADAMLVQSDTSASPKLQYFDGGGVLRAIETTGTAPGTWVHKAFVRSGTTITIYSNGVANGTGTSSANISSIAQVGIGARSSDGAFSVNGNIDELRLSVGIARWTSNFTVPNEPYDAPVAGKDLFYSTPTPPSNRHLNRSNRNQQQRDFQEFISPIPAVIADQFFGGTFGWWPQAPKPPSTVKLQGWIAFSGNISVEAAVFTQPFVRFEPPPRPPHLARDWVAFSGNIRVQTPPSWSPATKFDPPPRPHNYAQSWIAFSGSEQTEDFPTFGIDFMPFAPGRAAKLWSRFGRQPQWWAYYFKAPITPTRDKHDSGDWIPRYRSRRPPVYEDSYYDELRRKWEWQQPEEEAPPPVVEHVPNLLIPIGRLIHPVRLPSLSVSPPYRPVPSLTTNPPEFHMATHDEMATDDEMIIRMLLED